MAAGLSGPVNWNPRKCEGRTSSGRTAGKTRDVFVSAITSQREGQEEEEDEEEDERWQSLCLDQLARKHSWEQKKDSGRPSLVHSGHLSFPAALGQPGVEHDIFLSPSLCFALVLRVRCKQMK